MLPSPVLRLIALLLVWFSVSGFSTGARFLAPDADLWTRWEAHDPASQQSLDHSPWQFFLDRYRQDGANDDAVRVAYDRVDEDGRALLESYLASLSAVSVSTLNRAEQFAYWVNLYNALTVRVVLEAYPVDSIRDIDISPGFFASGPWGAKLIAVEGEELTLNDIEHRILRPIWQDPRVHYVVNCASIGCPDLPEQALSAQNAEAVMQQAARSYINSSRGVRIRGEKVTVSSIYDWFYDDFGVRDRDVFNHLLDFAEPELRKNLEAIGEISGTDYDWSLNDAS